MDLTLVVVRLGAADYSTVPFLTARKCGVGPPSLPLVPPPAKVNATTAQPCAAAATASRFLARADGAALAKALLPTRSAPGTTTTSHEESPEVTIYTAVDAPMVLRSQCGEWEMAVNERVDCMMGSSTVGFAGDNPPNPGRPPCLNPGEYVNTLDAP